MRSPEAAADAGRRKIALLWDESFLWGVMAHHALRDAGIPFEPIRSDAIRRGCLGAYGMLLVPGGWASHKMAALGPEGADAVKQFVSEGGAYLGICGGAGLATLDGIGLVNVRRHSGKERVPSFSGRIRLTPSGGPLWRGIDDPVFHAYWPSQFSVSSPHATVLASYGEALPDAFSSDVNVGDAAAGASWARLEALYGIHLDPARLRGEPAIIEGAFGRGNVILSLVHLDTVGDPNGRTALRNLWEAASGAQERRDDPAVPPAQERARGTSREATIGAVARLEREVDELIALGIRNFLWFWRTPLLLQWRRGVRGLEYCTLHVLTREIAERVRAGHVASEALAGAISELPALLTPFAEGARRLLVLERHAMTQGQLTYNRCDDGEVQEIRARLFSSSKSHGGSFKQLVDAMDAVLFQLLSGSPERG